MTSYRDRANNIMNTINGFLEKDKYGWQVSTTRGVFRLDENKSQAKTGHGKDEESDHTTTIACHNAVVPIGIYENIDSGKRKIELAYIDVNTHHWKSVIVDMSLVASAGQVTRLSDDGIMVDSNISKNFVSYLSRVISDESVSIEHYDSKSVMGWIDEEQFVPYAEDIVMDNATEQKQLFNCFSERGTLDEWTAYVRPLRDNIIARLAMAASFASPLVEITGQNSFVYHMFGGTGSGKTVALMLAASVWGNPDQGKLVRTLNMTKNSMLSMAAFLRNLPMFGDELQTIKANFNNSYDSIIMCLTEGIERARLNMNAEMKETRSWKCSFIFTGEENCVKQSSGGGAKNRVIAAECTDKIIKNGTEAANFFRKHYGCAGRQFIESLRDVSVNDLYTQYFHEIITDTDIGTTDKQAGAMALLMVADHISVDLFWPEQAKLTIEDVKPYLCSAIEIDVAERAYQYVCSLIARFKSNFGFYYNGSEYNKPREIWGKFVTNPAEKKTYALFNQAVLEEQLAKQGYDFDSCKSAWVRSGYLSKGIDGRYASSSSVDGIKARYVRVLIGEETKDE